MMQPKDIKLINGALQERWYTRLSIYFPRKADMPPPSSKTLEMYNQGKNPFCTAFACATCASYNTGRKFSNEELDAWSRKNIRGGGSIPSATVNRFCTDFGFRSQKISYTESLDFMRAGYAVIMNIAAPREMFADGINDGIIDGHYDKKITMSHEITAIRSNLGKQLINTWARYHDEGYHNIYQIKTEQLEEILRNKVCFIIY